VRTSADLAANCDEQVGHTVSPRIMHVESVSPVTHVKKGGKDQMAGYVNPLDEVCGRKGLFETVPFDALSGVG
jgi:hypothetical protein